MKITIEFDSIEHAKIAMKGHDYLSMLEEVDNYAHSILKHTDSSDEVENHLQKIREMINGIHLE